MPAGSVRLPELRQDIKVDTKDLDRAIAAARRFKTEMDRSLASSSSGGLDKSFADLERRITRMSEANRKLRASTDEVGASFRAQVADVDRFATSMDGADESMRRFAATARSAFNIDASKYVGEGDKVAATMRSLVTESRELLTSQQELGAGFRETRDEAQQAATALAALQAAASAARGDLSRGFDVDISRWKQQMDDARQVITGLRDDTQDAAVAAELLGEAMRGMRADTADTSRSISGLTQSLKNFQASVIGAFDIDTSKWRSEVGLVQALMRDLADDSERVVASQQRLGEAFRLSRDNTDEHTAALRALADAAENVSGGVNRLEAQVAQLGNTSKSSGDGLRNIERDVRNLSRGTSLASRGVRELGDGIKLLGGAGVIAGGIGVLGGAVIGLGAAASGAVPIALGLTGALGGLGVSVLGLKAIFTDNKGLEPAVESLKKAFSGIQDDLQNRVNPSIVNFLKQVEGLAPLVRRNVPAFANAFRELTDGAANMLRDSAFRRDLEAILQSGIRQFRVFGEAGIVALRGIIGLAAETGPFVERIGALTRDAARDFTAWVAEARRTGEINALLSKATDILVGLGRTVRDLAVGFKNLFTASNLSGFTDAVLATLSGIAADFRAFTAERQADLQAMFGNLTVQVSALRPLFAEVADAIRVILTGIDLRPLLEGAIAILPNLAGGLVEAANAASRLGREAAPVINSLITLVRGLIDDAERIGTAFLRNVLPAIDAVRPGVERLGEALAKISESVLPVLGGALRNLGQAASSLVGFLAPVAEFIGSAVGLLGNLDGVLGQVLTAMVALKVGQAIFGNLAGVIRGTVEPTTRLQTAVNAVAAPVRNLAGSFGQLGERMQVQQQLARSAGQELTRFQAITAALQTSQSGLARTLGDMGATFDRHVQAAKGITAEYGTIDGQATRTTNGLGRFAGTITGTVGAALTGFRGALSGISGVLGGPWGIALTAGITALTLFGEANAKAKQEQEALRNAVNQANGVIDANVVSVGKAQTESEYLAVAAEKLGKSQTEVVQAFLASGAPIDDYINKITDGAGVSEGFWSIGDRINAMLGSQQAQSRIAAGELKSLAERTKEAQEEQRRHNEALTRSESAMSGAERVARDVAKGFDTMRQSAGDASKAIDGLSSVMDGLRGATASADEAEKNFGAALRDLQGAATEAGGGIRILNGDLDATTEAGGRASDASIKLRDATLESAKAAFDLAGGQQNLQGALEAANGKLREGRQALIDSLTQMGVNREEATKYADSLFNIPPEVLTRILADPANAQKTYEDWKKGIPADPAPAQAPIGGNVAPLNQTLEDAKRQIFNQPPALAPVGANPAPLQADVKTEQDKIAGGDPTQMPVGAVTQIAQAIVGELVKSITAPAGGPPKLPVGADITIGEQEALAWVARINAFQAAKLPVGANVAPGEQEALAWVARINAYPGARLPIHANFEQFNLELSNRLSQIAAAPVPVPISANIDRLNQQYNEAFQFISQNIVFVPLAANIDRLNQQYAELFQFISTNIIYVPIAGDFSYLINEYYRIVQILQTTPIIIPIYGQFMGLIGGAGGGGGGGGGGTIAAAQGTILEHFASGGISARDRAAMKKLMGGGVTYNAAGNVAGQLQAAMGLTPMAADQAQIVGPNTWRVVGDRAVGDEAFIPLVNTPRSHALLEEAASRMGYVLSKFAAGGFGNASSSTTTSGASDGGYTSVQNSSTQEAPLIGGDLVLTIPQDTPVQDAFDEATFQLRRLKRGGVHVRNKARGR